MSAIVELDDRGRVLIPAEIRRRVKSRRFKVSTRGRLVELEPLERVEELRGKFRHVIRHDWEKLEEMGEDFVRKR